MAHGGQKAGGGRKPRSVGAYGSTRGKERQRRRADARALDPRYQKAMDETRRQQDELDALIEKQKNEPAVGAAAGALIDAQIKAKQKELEEAQAAEEVARAEAEVCGECGQPIDAEKGHICPTDEPEPEGWPDAPVAGFRQPLSEVIADGAGQTGLPKTYVPRKLDKRKLRKDGEGNFQFSTITARMMLKQGYHVEYVLDFTGVGYEDVRDLPLDDEGYGIIPGSEEEIE